MPPCIFSSMLTALLVSPRLSAFCILSLGIGTGRTGNQALADHGRPGVLQMLSVVCGGSVWAGLDS